LWPQPPPQLPPQPPPHPDPNPPQQHSSISTMMIHMQEELPQEELPQESKHIKFFTSDDPF